MFNVIVTKGEKDIIIAKCSNWSKADRARQLLIRNGEDSSNVKIDMVAEQESKLIMDAIEIKGTLFAL